MSQPSSYCLECGGPCRMAHNTIQGIPGVKVSSPMRMFDGRTPIPGKPLTDRRIAFWQSEGKYGPLAKPAGPRCGECGGTKRVKRLDYSYLPKTGYYCTLCVQKHRQSRDAEKKLAALVRERRNNYA